MNFRFLLLPMAATLLSTGPARADWQARWQVDEFTDNRSCRVERFSPFARGFLRGMTHTAISLHFFVESYNGEVRAGVRSEPEMPLNDVQIRVDDYPMTVLGVENAPNDTRASYLDSFTADPYVRPDASPEEREALEQAMNSTMDAIAGFSSPYRVFTGDEALELLNQMVGADRVIFRMVGQNTALSTTGEFEPNDRFFQAIEECGINLVPPSGAEPTASRDEEMQGTLAPPD